MNRILRIETPTGPAIVTRPVAEQLLKQGVISGSLDGELRAADAAMMKAAMLTVAGLCDFCSAPGAVHAFDVPDFPMPGMTVMSTGGWGACDTCADLVRAGKKKELLDRSVGNMSFSKFTRSALKELHDKFWNALEVDKVAVTFAETLRRFIDGNLPADVEGVEIIRQSPRATRLRLVKDEAGLTDAEVAEIADGTPSTAAKAKLLHWYHKTGGTPGATKLLGQKAAPHKPMVFDVPHWQRALDAKFEALTSLSSMLKAPDASEFFTESVDLNDPAAMRTITQLAQERRQLRELGFAEDVRYLRDAATYSFNAETIAAIREAAKSIPADSPLSAIETPNTGAGWFWFAEPLRITASPLISDRVHALLWSWTQIKPTIEFTPTEEILARLPAATREKVIEVGQLPSHVQLRWMERNMRGLADTLRAAGITEAELNACTRKVQGQPMLVFSAYVIDENGRWLKKGCVAPSTRFFWPFEDSLREMLDGNVVAWRDVYGPGTALGSEPYVMAEADTMKAVEELSRFFVMACVWFKQTVSVSKKPVLTTEPGHVERHQRKRLQREHKLDAPPTVRVVALRKSARVDGDDVPAERREGAREYQCRWVVKGHPRKQPCGPGRKDHKLIWIETHIAGPDDKPFRERDTVFAVIR